MWFDIGSCISNLCHLPTGGRWCAWRSGSPVCAENGRDISGDNWRMGDCRGQHGRGPHDDTRMGASMARRWRDATDWHRDGGQHTQRSTAQKMSINSKFVTSFDITGSPWQQLSGLRPGGLPAVVYETPGNEHPGIDGVVPLWCH